MEECLKIQEKVTYRFPARSIYVAKEIRDQHMRIIFKDDTIKYKIHKTTYLAFKKANYHKK